MFFIFILTWTWSIIIWLMWKISKQKCFQSWLIFLKRLLQRTCTLDIFYDNIPTWDDKNVMLNNVYMVRWGPAAHHHRLLKYLFTVVFLEDYTRCSLKVIYLSNFIVLCTGFNTFVLYSLFAAHFSWLGISITVLKVNLTIEHHTSSTACSVTGVYTYSTTLQR